MSNLVNLSIFFLDWANASAAIITVFESLGMQPTFGQPVKQDYIYYPSLNLFSNMDSIS